MKKLLILIGVGLVAFNQFKDTFKSNLKVKFKGINGGSLDFNQSKLKLTISITNTNPVDILIGKVTGKLTFGEIALDVNRLVSFELRNNETVNGSFTVSANSGEFLLQISDQLAAGNKPELIFKGAVNGEIDGQEFVFKFTQQIPVSII